MYKKTLTAAFIFIALLLNNSIIYAKTNTEQTLSIIKPDSVSKNVIGDIISRFEKNGLRVAAIKMIKLDHKRAKNFYIEHKSKPFFDDLVEFMTSGPIVVQVLEGENAITKNRSIMGNTNPQEAKPGTIRADFSSKVPANAVHGSDSPKSAKREISFFFKQSEIFHR